MRAFTEDLVAEHGRAAVLDSLTEATLSGNPAACFIRTFGRSLEAAEEEWLREAPAGGILPSWIALVDRGLPAGLVTRLLVLLGLLGLTVLWLVRHLGRGEPAVAGLVRSGQP